MTTEELKKLIETHNYSPAVQKRLISLLTGPLRTCTVCGKEFALKTHAPRRRVCYALSCEAINKDRRKKYYSEYYKTHTKLDKAKLDLRKQRAKAHYAKTKDARKKPKL